MHTLLFMSRRGREQNIGVVFSRSGGQDREQLSPWKLENIYSLCINILQDWELRVVGVQQYDSGQYQCQATSHPPSFIAATVSVVGELALVSTM